MKHYVSDEQTCWHSRAGPAAAGRRPGLAAHRHSERPNGDAAPPPRAQRGPQPLIVSANEAGKEEQERVPSGHTRTKGVGVSANEGRRAGVHVRMRDAGAAAAYVRIRDAGAAVHIRVQDAGVAAVHIRLQDAGAAAVHIRLQL